MYSIYPVLLLVLLRIVKFRGRQAIEVELRPIGFLMNVNHVSGLDQATASRRNVAIGLLYNTTMPHYWTA